MLFTVYSLDDGYGHSLVFDASTAYEAMQKCMYFLDQNGKDSSAKIEMYGGGRTLSMVHNGKTYSCLNK